MPVDPPWLETARAEGRILGERWAGPPPIASDATSASCGPASEPARKARRAKAARSTSATPRPARVVIEVDVPIRLASEANAGGKLGSKIGRKGRVKAAVVAALPRLAEPFPLPAVVTLTRLGGRELDAGDNLPRSLKAVKDVVAEYLGVQDTGRDPRVRWRFRQRPAWSAGCRVRIESRPAIVAPDSPAGPS